MQLQIGCTGDFLKKINFKLCFEIENEKQFDCNHAVTN